MFSISANSLILRMVPRTQRARAIGLWSGGFLLGGIAGPALGGVVTSVSIRLPFFVYAATLTVAGMVGVVALRATPLADRADAAASVRTPLRVALRHSAFRAALAANFADSWAAMGVRAALVPLFVADVLHRSAIWTGIGFLVVAAVNAVTLLPAGRYADRVGRKPVLVGGCVASASSFVVLAVAPDLAGYVVSMVLLGFGSGLLDVAPAAVVGDVVEGRGGPVFAAYSMSSDVGTVTGPVTAGRIADVSYGDAFAVTAGILLASAAVGAMMRETRSEPQSLRGESAERVPEVGEQVVDGLEPDREPDEVARDLQRGARSAGMGHAPGVLDE
jgi:MFS family permease